MLQLDRNVLSVALASAILLGSAAAHAQSTTTSANPPDATSDNATNLDTVRVTGIRRGIEDAIDTKQSSTSIVEAISAEDIGKLPDSSIADSIARLPGLTAQRFGGRPQEINIRGFAGDFSTTLLNGREQVSLGNNRGVEFDQYPSELVNQVVVYKTPDASLVGQGLSGTVDLQTVRPLSFGERVIAVNARGDLNDRDDDKRYGNRFSISYIDQFADNTVGLALGYARLNNPQQGHQFEANSYSATTGFLESAKVYDIQDDNQRDGFVGVLEFKPNDDFHSTLDIFYSKFDKEQTKRGMEFTLNNAVGTPDRFTFDNFRPIVRSDYNAQDDTLFAIGFRNELRINDNWTLRADISNSSGKRQERILESYAGLPDSNLVGDTGTATFNRDGYFDFDLGLNYADPSILVLTDPGAWGQDGYIKDFEVEDQLTTVRLDLNRRFDSGFISSIDFGVNLTDRTKSRSSNENFLCLNACVDQAERPIPSDLLGRSAFDFAHVTGVLGYDALRAFNSSIYNRRGNNHGDIATKNWDVNERVTTAHMQFNVDTDLGPVPVKGNIGIQAVNAEQRSTGFQTTEGNAVGAADSGGTNYTNYLPSMNLSFSLPADQRIRFAAARQVARPRMDELRANDNITVNRTRDTIPDPNGGPAISVPFWERNGGDPELKPWLADAYDLSYEKYFGGNKGYISAAYFFKDLKTYIYNQVTQFDVNDTSVDLSTYPVGAGLPGSPIGEFSRPTNGEGGIIRGTEFAVSVPLDLLWKPLEGFGFVGSYSDTSSSIAPNGPGTTEPLPGLSKYVSNLTLFYERYGVSVRGSQRHRSSFLGEVQGFGGDRTRIQFEGETIYDLQLGYTFQSGALKDLSVLLQANNLNNAPFSSTLGTPDQPRQYFDYGRTYLLGVSYRF
ncbi:MAG: TonB-dependent receptor [Luteimonas sp.]